MGDQTVFVRTRIVAPGDDADWDSDSESDFSQDTKEEDAVRSTDQSESANKGKK